MRVKGKKRRDESKNSTYGGKKREIQIGYLVVNSMESF